MKDLDTFLPHVLVVAPGCAEPTAISALRQAAIQFCEATRAWRYEDEFQVSGKDCSVVCVPVDAELFQIETVTFNGQQLEPISISELDRKSRTWRDDEVDGTPRYYTQVEFDTIQVVPRATGQVQVYAFLRPSEEAEQVPDFLADKFQRVIASGALADLLLIPGQPFFNPDLAAVHAQRFQSAMNRNFNLNVRGQQRAPTRVKPHYF